MTYQDGVSAFRSGDYEKAISEFQKAIERTITIIKPGMR